MQLWLTEPERDLLECALIRMRWELAEDKMRMLDGGQKMACRYTTRRIDELLARLEKPEEQA